MDYEKETQRLLRELGVNSSYTGFRYTSHAVALTLSRPELITYISKGLYTEIAIQFHTTAGCVERDIRTVVNTIWLRGDRELLNHIFGTELQKKPRNTSFIDALSQYVLNFRLSREQQRLAWQHEKSRLPY